MKEKKMKDSGPEGRDRPCWVEHLVFLIIFEPHGAIYIYLFNLIILNEIFQNKNLRNI